MGGRQMTWSTNGKRSTLFRSRRIFTCPGLTQTCHSYQCWSSLLLTMRVRNYICEKNSSRFTLEKYVSDYCNIKTNTGTIQLFLEIVSDLISKQIQAFWYLISSSISANNALLRLLVKKGKCSLNFPNSSISQKAFKGFYPVEPIGNRNHGIVHEFAILDCSTGHCELKTFHIELIGLKLFADMWVHDPI